MDDNEFLLFDRLEKIKSVINKYGEDKFALSFSGGKDSTVLSWLVDEALPGNRIPRVYSDTGIELNMVRDFVFELRKTDDRIVILKPKTSIKPMLERDGYPFKSKYHSRAVWEWWHHRGRLAERYYYGENVWTSRNCPEKLKYQFENKLPFEISNKCCSRLKKEPLIEYQNTSGRVNAIIGIMPDEGGVRENAKCMTFYGSHFNFQPLVPVTKAWEDWLIEKEQIKICDIYKPPYNFKRTGCKGCPFALDIQKELDIMRAFFPKERKQCEIIWKPVYDEYRRLGYRLKKDDGQIAFDYV